MDRGVVALVASLLLVAAVARTVVCTIGAVARLGVVLIGLRVGLETGNRHAAVRDEGAKYSNRARRSTGIF